jgi:hypothetical protein
MDLAQARGDEVMHLGVEQQWFEGTDAAQQRVDPSRATAVEIVVTPTRAVQKIGRVIAGCGKLRGPVAVEPARAIVT